VSSARRLCTGSSKQASRYVAHYETPNHFATAPERFAKELNPAATRPADVGALTAEKVVGSAPFRIVVWLYGGGG